jgi:hypothetical protein
MYRVCCYDTSRLHLVEVLTRMLAEGSMAMWTVEKPDRLTLDGLRTAPGRAVFGVLGAGSGKPYLNATSGNISLLGRPVEYDSEPGADGPGGQS